LILTCLLLCVTGVSAAQSRQYTIALGFPFPPWDVGPLEGVNYDLLTAICSANTPCDAGSSIGRLPNASTAMLPGTR
jgi:hypothetical protein